MSKMLEKANTGTRNRLVVAGFRDTWELISTGEFEGWWNCSVQHCASGQMTMHSSKPTELCNTKSELRSMQIKNKKIGHWNILRGSTDCENESNIIKCKTYPHWKPCENDLIWVTWKNSDLRGLRLERIMIKRKIHVGTHVHHLYFSHGSPG